MRRAIDTQALLRWVDMHNNYDPARFVDFTVDGAAVGAVHQDTCALCAQHPDVFQVSDDRVLLHPRLDDPPSRTAAVERVLEEWYARGVFSGWRGERYAVSTAFDAPPLMAIERSAAALFGTRQYGVHVNGLTRLDGQTAMWVARRSERKPEYPGQLDHLVAGGLAVGLTAYDTAVKECQEEAGVPEALARHLRPAGIVSYRRCVEPRSATVVVFCYDLELPESFVPVNADGEVAEFYLWPVERVIDTVTGTRAFKSNCNLVIIDFLVRHGYLCPEDPHYIEIGQRLRSAE
ncbi:MAG: DUF4743 domain-containing protein [Anaerolineae bacterium]|nr:DUF4743 domain-containing protein [Anaerolineae bacterium]